MSSHSIHLIYDLLPLSSCVIGSYHLKRGKYKVLSNQRTTWSWWRRIHLAYRFRFRFLVFLLYESSIGTICLISKEPHNNVTNFVIQKNWYNWLKSAQIINLLMYNWQLSQMFVFSKPFHSCSVQIMHFQKFGDDHRHGQLYFDLINWSDRQILQTCRLWKVFFENLLRFPGERNR